jgi:drug/metabolite transporter (DMT)-like permease
MLMDGSAADNCLVVPMSPQTLVSYALARARLRATGKQAKSRRMSRLQADLFLLFAAVIWGLAFVFQKSAMSHVGPLTFLAARGVVAALALLPLAIQEARDQPEGDGRGLAFLPIAVGGGVAFFIGGWLQQAGLITATVTNTGFLTALYVVITPFIAWAWSGKRPNPLVWPAAALSALGTWLLGGGTLSSFSTGDMLVAFSAVLWAFHVVITGRAAQFRRPIGFTAVQFAIVAALAGAGAFLFETVTVAGLTAAWRDIAYVGLLSSALTFTLLTVALQHTPPSEAAVIVSMEVLFAALAAYLLLNEHLSAIGWFGAAMILSGTLLVQLGSVWAARFWRV